MDRPPRPLSEAAHRGDWQKLAELYKGDVSALLADAELLDRVRNLARFNLAAQRAVRAWRGSIRASRSIQGGNDLIASLAIERLLASVEGRTREARCLLAQELAEQPEEPAGPYSVQAPHDVIDLITRSVRTEDRLRVRGVARPLPDLSPGLGDPGSIFTMGLLGFPEAEFERGRPLDLVGSWNSSEATFEVHRVVRLGLWPGHRLALSALGLDEGDQDVASLSDADRRSDPAPPPSRDFIREALALTSALATFDKAAATSKVSFRTLGDVHRLLAPSASKVGRVRSAPAMVLLGSKVVYRAPDQPVARLQVGRLLRWLGRTAQSVHPLPRAAEAWARLNIAHPFTDGNGRVARALATWILVSAGYRPLGATQLRDFAHRHVLEFYDRQRWYEGESLLWYQFCVDSVLATFEPPTLPWSSDQTQHG
jgi:Fic/DOC family